MVFSNRYYSALLFSLLLTFASSLAMGQSSPMYPSSNYNEAIPTPTSFLGYEIGDDLTEHYQMLGYIRELEKAAPERVKLIQIGMTQERRP
ncbi:MAG TPA: hypothetical protein DCE78_04140, partial [Bacteroidetes bacterium]|nr:hypothetical protein [Bacteroidota bacterium]